jgi:hypothetical protein
MYIGICTCVRRPNNAKIGLLQAQRGHGPEVHSTKFFKRKWQKLDTTFVYFQVRQKILGTFGTVKG